jgi:translation initiation factor 3 subunit M
MATFIHLSGEDFLQSSPAAAVEAVGAIVAKGVSEAEGDAKGKAFTERFDALLGQGGKPEQQLKALLEQEPKFSQAFTDAESPEAKKEWKDKLDALFTVVFLLFTQLPAKQQNDVGELLLKQLEGNTSDGPWRLRLMMMLYNAVEVSSPLRPVVFRAILKYSEEISAWDTIRPYCEQLESWMKDWNLPKVEQTRFFLRVAELYRAHGRNAESLAVMHKCMKLYEDGGDVKEAADGAVLLIRHTLMAPSVLDISDVLALRAVQGLAGTKEGRLVELLTLFRNGDLDGFGKFSAKHKDLFGEGEDKLSLASCESKMKLLTLSTLAGAGTELPLSAVASKLKLSEDEAETWVIRAVSSGILDARVDQPKRMVMVKSVFKRTFESEDWSKLHDQLGQWIQNLERLQDTIASTEVA